MWDMCQMLNIWHISHTKPNLSPFSRCGIWYIFCNIEQYCDKFATVRNACGILFILCLFLFLSHISFIFSFSNSSPPPSPLSHISPCSSPSARSTYVPPSPLSHTLSSSLSPFALFSSHSWIWATTNFVSTITNLICPFTGFFSHFSSLSPLCSISESPIGLWVCNFGLWVCDFGLWSAWVFRLWVSPLCSILSRWFAVHRSQSVDSLFYLWRFHRFTVSQVGFIDSFYIKFSVKVLFLCLLFFVTEFESLNLIFKLNIIFDLGF